MSVAQIVGHYRGDLDVWQHGAVNMKPPIQCKWPPSAGSSRARRPVRTSSGMHVDKTLSPVGQVGIAPSRSHRRPRLPHLGRQRCMANHCRLFARAKPGERCAHGSRRLCHLRVGPLATFER
jgi:hypothetical protein